MSDVFISYSRRDEDAVQRIKKSLTRRGIDVWIDKDDIGTGSRWDMQIQEGIQKSDKILIMLSKASIVSQNVSDEWGYALEKGKHIIPVLLEDCDVPMRIASLQRIEFVEDYDKAMEKLVTEIRAVSVSSKSGRRAKKARKFQAPTPVLNILKFALPALLLIGGFFFGYQHFLSSVSVPDVHGLSSEAAASRLSSGFLNVGNIYQEYSEANSAIPGTVLRTDPSIDTPAERFFGKIDLYLVKAKIQVPDLVGLSHSQATEKLVFDGLTVGKHIIEYADGEETTVFKTLPAFDTYVKDSDPIDIYIVKDKIEIPNVIGLDGDAARQRLEELNLNVSVVHSVRSWNENYGKIFEMVPSAGTKVNPNTVIQLTLADKGGWVYLKQGKKGDIVAAPKSFNLRNDTDASTSKTIVGKLQKGALIKILRAKSNGWRLVRLYKTQDVEESVGQL